MLTLDRDFQKIAICFLIPAFLAAVIFLPNFDPLALLPEILAFIVFLEFVCAIQPTPQQCVCAACHFEILPRSPPTF
jgi:hypothetical protein